MSWNLRLPFLSLSFSPRAVAVGFGLLLLVTLGTVLAYALAAMPFLRPAGSACCWERAQRLKE